MSPPSAISDETPGPRDSALGQPVRCGACDHVNPEKAAYCNRCGTRVGREVRPAVLPDPAVDSADAAGEQSGRPPSDVGRRALAIMAVGLAVVVGLYLFSMWNASSETAAERAGEVPAQSTSVAQRPSGPVPALPDSAAQQRADGFAALNTADGWFESGRFYLTAAWEAQQSDPATSARWAQRAVADFEKSLSMEEDLNVRLALAEASTLDPSQPMRPVQELQAILQEDPNHVGANLLMGERRLMIGRPEDAVNSFETVIALTEPGDPFRQQAEQFLAAARSQIEQSGG